MRHLYPASIIEALEWLADIEFQRIAWFENDQNLFANFDEQYMWVFEDTALLYAMDNGDVAFSHAADNKLRELAILMEAIDWYKENDEELLVSPKMAVIRQKAREALDLIHASDGSEKTVVYLTPGDPIPRDGN